MLVALFTADCRIVGSKQTNKISLENSVLRKFWPNLQSNSYL